MVAVMSELVQIQEAEMAVLTYEKSVKVGLYFNEWTNCSDLVIIFNVGNN